MPYVVCREKEKTKNTSQKMKYNIQHTTYNIQNGGFTIIEIIIVIAIFSILAASGATPLLFLKNKNALVNAAEGSVSLLAEARARTLSSKSASRYGVHFAPDRAVLFKGVSFNANDPENEPVFFGSAVRNSA